MKKMKKGVLVGMIILLIAALMVSCASQPATTTGGGESNAGASSQSDGENPPTNPDAKVIKVGFSWSDAVTMFYQAYMDYLVEAARLHEEETGVRIEYIDTIANRDVNKQASDIRDLITQEPVAIFIHAQDATAIQSSIKEVRDAGIPCIMTIRTERQDEPLLADAYVGLDAFDQGYTTGQYMFAKMEADGIIGKDIKLIDLLGNFTDENSINRSAGMRKAADEIGGVTIVQEVESEWDSDKAQTRLTAALIAHPETNALFIGSDFLVPACQIAMQKADMWKPYGDPGHVYFGGQDVYPEGYEMLATLYMDASTVWDHWLIALDAVQLIQDIVDGKPIEYDHFVKGRVITQENVFTAEMIWARDYLTPEQQKIVDAAEAAR